MIMAMPYGAITASFPPTERGKALGINAISISAGLAVGPSWAASFLQKATLENSEATASLSGLQHTYLAGAILTGIAVITSFVRSKEEK